MLRASRPSVYCLPLSGLGSTCVVTEPQGCKVHFGNQLFTGTLYLVPLHRGREQTLDVSRTLSRITYFFADHVNFDWPTQAMGVASAAFHGRLLPVLVEWATASEEACRIAALEALLALTRSCWPRLGLHGNKLVEYLKERSVEHQSDRELELQEVVFGALKDAGSAVRVG